MGRRDMGSTLWIDVVDRSGRIQVVFALKKVARAVDVHLGDVIGSAGVPFKSRKGEPTLFCVRGTRAASPARHSTA